MAAAPAGGAVPSCISIVVIESGRRLRHPVPNRFSCPSSLMANLRNRFPARRRFLKQSAALTASASIAAPVMALVAARAPEEPVAADEVEARQAVSAVASPHAQRRPR